jgi:hypothetical protein
MENRSKEARFWFNVLDAALKIPGSKIDRETFLQKQCEQYCDSGTVENILQNGAANAGVELTLMDKMSSDVIEQHTKVATAISFAAGIPGGLAMAATIPADIAQFYYHVIVVAQKLAYIYGLENIDKENEYFKSVLTVFIGVMAGIEEADKTMNELMTAQFTKSLGKITLGKILDKTVTRIAIVIGLNLTKGSVIKSAAKFVPLVGGLVSGGVTLLSFLPMCNNLKNRFCDSINTAKRNNIIKSFS